MSDYTSTFTESTGDTIDTTDFSTEFDAIETAIATKVNVGDDITGKADSADSINETGASTVMNMKVVDIGDWDMNATGSVAVAHGITQSKLRSFTVMIRHDNETIGIYDFSAAIGDNLASVGSTNINLTRDAAGTFAATTFDSTPYNRGWITLWYTD